MAQHPLYSTWFTMVRRCKDPRHKMWHRYGGRGIRVCDRWLSFENFCSDVGPRPSPTHTIDRIDNDGGYEPDNFRWATPREQARNRSNTRTFERDGVTYKVDAVAREHGIQSQTIFLRASQGKSFAEIISRHHLEPGFDLVRHMISKARERNITRTHCKHGHEFTPENTRVTAQGYRKCRTCYRNYSRAQRAKTES